MSTSSGFAASSSFWWSFTVFFSHQIHKKCSERSNTDFTTSLLTSLVYVAYTFCVQGFATTLLRNQHTVQCDISCATRNARIQGLLDTDGSVASKHKILRTSWVDRNCRQCDGLTAVGFCTLTVLNNLQTWIWDDCFVLQLIFHKARYAKWYGSVLLSLYRFYIQ